METTSELEVDQTSINGQETARNTSFILANTRAVSLPHLKKECTVPVFSKDNECTIAHQEFIESTWNCAQKLFKGHQITDPEIRASHIIKGRIPSAIGKPVKELREHEKTIYYERMMFVIEIPTISETIAGNKLNLTLGGVRAYNQENLYNRKTLERFKVFIGFKNMVCTNLLVSSDGLALELKAGSVNDLGQQIVDLIGNYSLQSHLKDLSLFVNQSLSEREFAQLVGRLRLYQYAPKNEISGVISPMLTDSQVSHVVSGYYNDTNACRERKGNISFWRLYNLFTGANKSSYIDSFLNRGVQAHDFVRMLGKSKENQEPNWYLH